MLNTVLDCAASFFTMCLSLYCFQAANDYAMRRMFGGTKSIKSRIIMHGVVCAVLFAFIIGGIWS
tara:strand:- start:219 stop:413 length:195 start_codon:yes stop_codon:yes gene_type:complete